MYDANEIRVVNTSAPCNYAGTWIVHIGLWMKSFHFNEKRRFGLRCTIPRPIQHFIRCFICNHFVIQFAKLLGYRIFDKFEQLFCVIKKKWKRWNKWMRIFARRSKNYWQCYLVVDGATVSWNMRSLNRRTI